MNYIKLNNYLAFTFLTKICQEWTINIEIKKNVAY